LRHRAKYSGQIKEFSVQDKSPIRNGLVRERQCTDMFCAVAFAVCFLGFLGVSAYAIVTGKPERMFSGVDG